MSPTDPSFVSRKRRKRQDNGGALGGILKTLFGVAYSQEVSNVAARHNFMKLHFARKKYWTQSLAFVTVKRNKRGNF
jgi:hypothetical protein